MGLSKKDGKVLVLDNIPITVVACIAGFAFIAAGGWSVSIYPPVKTGNGENSFLGGLFFFSLGLFVISLAIAGWSSIRIDKSKGIVEIGKILKKFGRTVRLESIRKVGLTRVRLPSSDEEEGSPRLKLILNDGSAVDCLDLTVNLPQAREIADFLGVGLEHNEKD